MILKNEKIEVTEADIFMLQLIVAHWFIAAFITSYPFHTQVLGFVVGGFITLCAFLAYNFYAGTQFFRVTVALSLLSFSILFIQQMYGRIEFHFHIFVVLAFLMIYRDRLPVAVGSVFIILHHQLFNFLQQNNISLFDMKIVVFNYGCGIDIVLLHGIFVIAEWFILDILIRGKIKEYNLIVEAKEGALLMNKTINQEKAKYKKLMNLASDGIILMNKNLEILECSDMAASMLGYETYEMQNLNLFDCARHITHEEITQLLEKINDVPILFNTIFTKKNGIPFEVELSIVEITIERVDFIYISIRHGKK